MAGIKLAGRFPYRECEKCDKAIRDYNKSGFCSSCQNKEYDKRKKKKK